MLYTAGEMDYNTAEYYGSNRIRTPATWSSAQCLNQLSYLPAPDAMLVINTASLVMTLLVVRTLNEPIPNKSTAA